MKKFAIIMTTIVLFTLASCKNIFTTPTLVERGPDKVNNPTKTMVANETPVQIPQGTTVKSCGETQATLTDDTTAKTKDLVTSKDVVLPKNTAVVLPEKTELKTSQPTNVNIGASSEVVLPAGTEITTHKLNWYAALFYLLLVVVAGYWYMKVKGDKDDNQDGIVDEPAAPVVKKPRKAKVKTVAPTTPPTVKKKSLS
jgi:hypothetical protein